MKKTDNYVVRGFTGSAVSAGIKKDRALDLALIYSETQSTASGVFTTNTVKAAPVILSKQHIEKGKARAIVANAGNANACTGAAGLDDARLTAALVAEALGIDDDEVLVASTGVIGLPLDMALVRGAVPALVKGLSAEGIPLVSQAIMTTDSFPKISRFNGTAGGRPYHILGVAKGAGMIMPHMATMLAFVLSDIQIDSNSMKRALVPSVRSTFNRISVDGETSTNDMVLAMANGTAENGALSEDDFEGFAGGLKRVLGELARMMVQDGEGATKVIDIYIKGAASAEDALTAARTVANSNLVKTACYGGDPNWGRIMAAMGRAGIVMAEDRVDIWVDDVQLVQGGVGKGPKADKKAAQCMAGRMFSFIIDLHQGDYQDVMTTCDLTHEYVTINADYRT